MLATYGTSGSHMTAQLRWSFLVPLCVLMVPVAGADQPPGLDSDQPAPLSEDEQRQITLSLLERYPQLASSPGVKYAAADSYPGATVPGAMIGAAVIYYPHAEHNGIKEAFQARCQREYPNRTWTCNDVTIRRYLKLASQDFEVRINGDISSEAALALIEASRRDLQAGASTAAGLPDTAIIINSFEEGRYLIAWGTPDGFTKLAMTAQLTPGGDPDNPDDWHASIFDSSEE